MSSPQIACARLDRDGVTVALALPPVGSPRVIHFGPSLPADCALGAILPALEPGPRDAQPDVPISPTIWPVTGFGWLGEPALALWRAGAGAALSLELSAWRQQGESLTVDLKDTRLGVGVRLAWRLDTGGVLVCQASVQNLGATPLHLSHCASACLPLPGWAQELIGFDGRWAGEVRAQRLQIPLGLWTQGSRTGRTGFQGASVVVCAQGASDQAGRMIGAHLGWSGDHEILLDTRPEGHRLLHLRPRLAPGEITLAPDAQFTTPEAMLAFSETGLQGLTDRFHAFALSRLPAPAQPPRPVHFNTWEAAYFDFDEARLMTLAEAAAALGVERFVLDDGWFVGRSDDRAGLGDWTVDPARFPRGLGPLIDHVNALGMSFGLWVEPEMVNPDSALYRAHPNWVLAAEGASRPTMRHQLILDLANPAVRAHLRDRLCALVSAHPGIAYLKWDYNRAAFPSESGGVPGTHARTAAFWTLLDELRAHAPGLEIESCASGGGRIDLGVLTRTTRVWASDQTDAIERLRIQRWTSLIVPLRAMGSHVGPSPNPITGRRLAMAFRARIALFGHMGVEADPGRMSDADKDVLKAHIALYKRFRDLLHRGRLLQWAGDDPGVEGRMVVSADGAEALALLARADMAAAAVGHPVRLPGLAQDADYQITLPEPWPTLAARKLGDPDGWRAGRVVSGALLAEVGLALPLIDPETAWLVHLTRVS